MSTNWAFDYIENKHTLYRGKYCVEKFCTSLREHAKIWLILKRKKMIQLTKEELKLHQDTKLSYVCGKRILKKLSKK